MENEDEQFGLWNAQSQGENLLKRIPSCTEICWKTSILSL